MDRSNRRRSNDIAVVSLTEQTGGYKLTDGMKSEMARVVVIGSSCVGKTTFARSLARVLSFPHVEMDALYWQPNWIPRASDEFRALIAQAVAQDHCLPTATTGLFVISFDQEPQL